MAQRIHCIRAAVNTGYGRIGTHPELAYSPPYAFKPANKYRARGVMRISEHMLYPPRTNGRRVRGGACAWGGGCKRRRRKR